MGDGDKLLRSSEVRALLGVSEATFWRRIKDGTIPHALRICGNSRWRLSDVHSVIARAEGQRLTDNKTQHVGKPGTTQQDVASRVDLSQVRRRQRPAA